MLKPGGQEFDGRAHPDVPGGDVRVARALSPIHRRVEQLLREKTPSEEQTDENGEFDEVVELFRKFLILLVLGLVIHSKRGKE